MSKGRPTASSRQIGVNPAVDNLCAKAEMAVLNILFHGEQRVSPAMGQSTTDTEATSIRANDFTHSIRTPQEELPWMKESHILWENGKPTERGTLTGNGATQWT